MCGYDIHWDTGLTLAGRESPYKTTNAADGAGRGGGGGGGGGGEEQFAPGPKFKETSNGD